jgi:hypothetical protein
VAFTGTLPAPRGIRVPAVLKHLAGHVASTAATAATAAQRTLARLRDAYLTIIGFGFVSVAAFQEDPRLGWAVMGVLVLLLEFRTDPDGKTRRRE